MKPPRSLASPPGLTSRRAILALFCFAISASSVLAQSASLLTLNLPPDIGSALSALPNARISAATAEGLPTFIKGDIDTVAISATAPLQHSDLAATIAKLAPLFRILPTDLSPRNITKDITGSVHLNYDQKKNGLPVIGTRLSVHIDKTGKVFAVSGNVRGDTTVGPTPQLAAVAAIAKARASSRSAATATTSSTRLAYILSQSDHALHLVYEIHLANSGLLAPLIDRLIYVDANTGHVTDVDDQVQRAESIEVRNANYDNTLSGTVVRSNNIGPTGNSVYDTNFNYLDDTYGYYYTYFGRDSIDNSGMTLKSSVNFRSLSWAPLNNAAWLNDEGTMIYGDGDGTNYRNFVYAIDITTHELTHGVTARTSGLIYENEPGAINEGMSDCMGAACKARSNSTPDLDPYLGDTICILTSFFRDMANPTADGYSKDFYPERYVLSLDTVPDGNDNDDGYVHYNSGIENLAFYLLVEGGQHPRAGTYSNAGGCYIPSTTVPSITLARAEQIWYLANTSYMGPGAQFMDLRECTVEAAQQLFGSTYATDVAIAWDVVGVPTYANREPINISTLGPVDDSHPMIAGFYLENGMGTKPMLIRGVGPSLAQLQVSGYLPNPNMTLYDSSSTVVDYNDDWSSSSNASAIASTAVSVQAFALYNPSYDAAMLDSLGAGGWTAVVAAPSGTSGMALVEVYDAQTSNPLHLVNISTRAYLTSTNSMMTAGFVIHGDGNKTLLIRGLGPALAGMGVSDTLPNPQIVLIDNNQSVLRSNDDWGTNEDSGDIATVTSKVYAYPLSDGSHDAALLVSLPQGAYTVQLSGVGTTTTGNAMVEVFEVP